MDGARQKQDLPLTVKLSLLQEFDRQILGQHQGNRARCVKIVWIFHGFEQERQRLCWFPLFNELLSAFEADFDEWQSD